MRKRRRRKRTLVTGVLFVICCILTVIIGVLLVSGYKASRKPVYEYVSMTDAASAKAYVWLTQIENTSLTYDEVAECMGDFNLEIVKQPMKKKNTYEVKLADGAYEYCQVQAQAGLEKAYKLSVKRRLVAAGCEEECTDELIESLMMEAYGVSVSDYLSGCDIKVFPTLEEIKSEYEGEVSYEDK